jgi:hypothetical protein
MRPNCAHFKRNTNIDFKKLHRQKQKSPVREEVHRALDYDQRLGGGVPMVPKLIGRRMISFKINIMLRRTIFK